MYIFNEFCYKEIHLINMSPLDHENWDFGAIRWAFCCCVGGWLSFYTTAGCVRTTGLHMKLNQNSIYFIAMNINCRIGRCDEGPSFWASPTRRRRYKKFMMNFLAQAREVWWWGMSRTISRGSVSGRRDLVHRALGGVRGAHSTHSQAQDAQLRGRWVVDSLSPD